MDKKQKMILDKGIYTRSECSRLVKLKEFIIVRKQNKKCLLLRFVNEADVEITGIDVVVTPIRANGKVEKKIDVSFDDLEVKPGEVFAPESGIMISDECVDFEVSVECVYSHDYFYVEAGGIVNAKYIPISGTLSRDLSKSRSSVKRIRVSQCILAAVVAVAGIAVFVAISAYLMGRPLGRFEELSAYLSLLG